MTSHPTPTPPADERLARLCSAFLDLLGAGGRVPPPVCDALVRALAEGASEVTAELRRDLDACDAALEHLGRLRESALLGRGGEVAAVCDGLTEARAKAARVVGALEALVTPSPQTPRLGDIADRAAPHEMRRADQGQPRIPQRPEKPAEHAEALRRPEKAPERLRQQDASRRQERPPPALPPPAPKRPAAEAAPPKAPVKPEELLPVSCPNCGEAGKVNWGKLGQVLQCPNCSKHFAIRSDGRGAVVVKDRDGRWREKGSAKVRRRRVTGRRLVAAALVLALVPAVGATAWWLTRPAQAAEAPLPTELEPRAELFGRAWLKGDVALMRRLTTPTQDKALYSWVKRHPAPAPAAEAAVAVNVVSGKGSVKTVHVRVDGPRAQQVTLTWEERGGAWYFVPFPAATPRSGQSGRPRRLCRSCRARRW